MDEEWQTLFVQPLKEEASGPDPLTCKHGRRLFIQACHHVSTEGNGDERVDLCADCGKFLICGHVNGQYFDITFALSTREMLAAAEKYINWLEEADESN